MVQFISSFCDTAVVRDGEMGTVGVVQLYIKSLHVSQVFNCGKAYSGLYGGKIAEKANARGNALDSGSSTTKSGHTCKRRLNSVLFVLGSVSFIKGTWFVISGVSYSTLSERGKIKRNSIVWPKEWVLGKQMKLTRLAERYGTLDKRVLKLQSVLC